MRSINATIVGKVRSINTTNWVINKVKIKDSVTLLTECGHLKLIKLMSVRARRHKFPRGQ